MDRLLELGINNPRTGQPVSTDFARKNLEANHLAIANLSDFRKGFPSFAGSNAEDASEWDLPRRRFASPWMRHRSNPAIWMRSFMSRRR